MYVLIVRERRALSGTERGRRPEEKSSFLTGDDLRRLEYGRGLTLVDL
jgi:hypothetical protein